MLLAEAVRPALPWAVGMWDARRVDPTIPADAADKLLAEGKTVEQARASFFELALHAAGGGGEAGVALGRRDVGADRGLLLGRDEALASTPPAR
jgi:hypothetical protein